MNNAIDADHDAAWHERLGELRQVVMATSRFADGDVTANPLLEMLVQQQVLLHMHGHGPVGLRRHQRPVAPARPYVPQGAGRSHAGGSAW